MPLSIGKAWDESRAILARDGNLVAVVVAALVVIPEALSNLIFPAVGGAAAATSDPTLGASMLRLLVIFCTLVGSLAITSLALRSGQSVGEAIGKGLKALLPVIGVALMFAIPLILILVAILVVGVGGSTPEQMVANIENMSAGSAFALLLFSGIALYLSLRIMLSSPIALTESHNPLEIIKRSWALTRGHALRLFGYAVLLFLVGLVLAAFAGMMGGILAKLVFGAPEPLTMSALVAGLFGGVASAIVVALSALMSARIYTQLTTTLSVPKVEH